MIHEEGLDLVPRIRNSPLPIHIDNEVEIEFQVLAAERRSDPDRIYKEHIASRANPRGPHL